MTGVWSWVRSIVLLLLLILAVEMLLPRSAFRQYLRLVAGMILVLVVMEPVLAWLGSVPTDIVGASGRREAGGTGPTRPANFLLGDQHGDGGPGTGDGGYGGGRLERRVQATVEAQVRQAFRESVAAAARAVVMESGQVADARAEVTLAGSGLDIHRVEVRVRARPGPGLSAVERERLRELVASSLGIPHQLVTVGEG